MNTVMNPALRQRAVREIRSLQNFGFELHDVARLLRKTMNERARELRLTQAQWRALVHLSRLQGCRQTDLADVLEVRPITLARLIDKLESSDLVERRRHPTDRRAVQLYLTPTANAIMERLIGLASTISEEAMTGLSPLQRQEMLECLETMHNNLTSKRIA
ncbi:MAG TPA: MarR family transcriptional regulator [Steroidobacteraceae bacterium]|nr:MarR family transcriptional regulator [Steroidobacteraceae bacterium]